MQTETEVRARGERGELLWWQIVVVACAVIVAVASVVIAYAELRQVRYLRQSNCAERVQASGRQQFNSTGEAEQALRRCFGE
jgi:hypothetical protein